MSLIESIRHKTQRVPIQHKCQGCGVFYTIVPKKAERVAKGYVWRCICRAVCAVEMQWDEGPEGPRAS